MHLKDSAFGALVASFPNTGFMGVPLLVALLGPAAAGPMICTILADLFVTTSLCIALAQMHDATGLGTRAALARALRGALSNPLPWSIAAGALFSVAGIQLAGPPEVVVRMLADSASPVALFTIGAVLCRAGRHAHSRTPVALYLPVALMKLFLHPLLVFVVAGAAVALGAPLSGFQIMVITLTAALPSASNVAMLAERYGADNGRITRIIMSSTVLAFVSFSCWPGRLGCSRRVERMRRSKGLHCSVKSRSQAEGVLTVSGSKPSFASATDAGQSGGLSKYCRPSPRRHHVWATSTAALLFCKLELPTQSAIRCSGLVALKRTLGPGPGRPRAKPKRAKVATPRESELLHALGCDALCAR